MNAHLTPDELAQLLRISRPKVLRYCAAGKFPHLRFGQEVRFTEAHVAAIVAGHEVAPKPTTEQADPWGHRGRRAS